MSRRSVGARGGAIAVTLERSSSAEHDPNGLGHDDEIQPVAASPQVGRIQANPFGVRDVRPSIDLPISGDAWTNAQKLIGCRSVPRQFLSGYGSGSHERHVTEYNVDQLGKLVKGGPPQKLAESRYTGVILELECALELVPALRVFHQFRKPSLGYLASKFLPTAILGKHRPKLVEPKRLAVSSDTLVAIKCGSRRVTLDHQADEDEGRAHHGQSATRQNDVGYPLHTRRKPSPLPRG